MLPDRYKLKSGDTISGGFGSVQKVHDSYLDRVVLFKSMHSAENNSQLENEIRLLSKARSRHVVEIYDVIRDDRGFIVGIIIEYLKGRDYSEFYKEAAGEPNLYLLVLYQIATALSALHQAGVVHRDLKLENMRESESKILKLFDFGISVGSEDYRTSLNRGTLVYAAPELYFTGARISAEMDVYALGVCAWALATDRFPAALRDVPPQSGRPLPTIATVMPMLPQEVCDVIDGCLNRQPQNRPSASYLSKIFSKHLVRGQHKGNFVQGNSSVFELSSLKNNVTVSVGALGSLKVVYDGLDFRVDAVSGHVYINNQVAVVGMVLHEACVLTYGPPEYRAARSWVTFSSSHPEVVL